MGQPAQETVSPHLVGGIHRVIRCGEVHICGLCQQGYEDHSSARGCLVQCWETQLKLDPVVLRQGPKHRIHFRCRFCARDYASRERARQCAAECRAHFSVKFEMEATLEPAPGLAPHERRRARGPTRVTLVRVPVAPKPLKRRPKAPEEPSPAGGEGHASPAAAATPGAQASTDATDSPGEKASSDAKTAGSLPELKGDASTSPSPAKTGASSGAKEASPSASEAPVGASEVPTGAAGDAPPAQKEVRGDPSKPFTRDGAQYVCSQCSAKYFTKDEVIKCFESHKT